jgi:hypothetical protein
MMVPPGVPGFRRSVPRLERVTDSLSTVEVRPGKQPSLDADARRLAAWLDTHKAIVLLAFTVIYLTGTVLHARSKPFWYDEIITVIAARAPDLAGTWRAALQVDAMPPLSHVLVHLAIGAMGLTEVAVRVPAMLGYWIFCLSLFWFAYRRVGIYFALTAMLMPVVTGAYPYSVEARAYGPELAFTGLALVTWQSAAENRRRWLALTGLGLSLVAALLCHYYAALLYLPLCGGECWRAYRARRIDWGIWITFALGTVPVFWRMATIVGVVKGFTRSWSPASPEQIMEYWETGLQQTGTVAALWLGLLALAIVANRKSTFAPDSAPAKVPEYEWVAGVLFLAIPTVAVIGGVLVTHTFTFRYALIGLTGFCLLAPLLAAYFLGSRALWGFVMFVVMSAGLGFATIANPMWKNPYDAEPMLREALRQGPVVVPDGKLFLSMWYYAPADVKSHLLFLANDEAAVRYMDFETIDQGLRELVPWASISLEEYPKFATSGREFLVYQNTLRPGWLLSKVVDDGAAVEIQKQSAYRSLVRVRLKTAP